jgi:nitrogen regulatory protein PII
MKEVKVIIRPERLSDVLQAPRAMPRFSGVTIPHVRGYGRRLPPDPDGITFAAVDMTRLEIVVLADIASEVVTIIEQTAHIGRFGDRKLFTSVVDQGAVPARRLQRREYVVTTSPAPARGGGEARSLLRLEPPRKTSSPTLCRPVVRHLGCAAGWLCPIHQGCIWARRARPRHSSEAAADCAGARIVAGRKNR